jgi:hypothetical protein
MVRSSAMLAIVLALSPAAASAQSTDAWTWSFDAIAFLDANMQRRDVQDVSRLESQNWISIDATHAAAGGTLTLFTILSAEALTTGEFGSPQLFQIGGPFLQNPIGDYASPRDLFSGLGGSFSRRVASLEARVDAAIVGAPALGPPGYENRPTASLNPQLPLSHARIDSTDAASSVVSAGVSALGFGLEAAAFRGRELDEHRYDLEVGALDSWAVRGSYRGGGWTAQVSGGHLHRLHSWAPFDTTRTTASVSFEPPSRVVSVLAAWGHDRDRFGALDSYMLDTAIHVSARDHLYVRGERVRDDFLDAGFHLLNSNEVVQLGTVGAFTAGYVRDVGHGLGVGGDVNLYSVPYAFTSAYQSPYAIHLFLRLHAVRDRR